LIEGASHLIIVVAAPTLIAQISNEPYRSIAMTLWSTFFGVAFALFAWLGMPLVTANGLPSLFIVHGVIMLGIAAILFWLLPSLNRSQPDRLSLFKILSFHKQAYRSPYIAAPAYGWLFYTLTFVSLLTVLPDLAPPEDRAFVAGLMPLASITTSLLCGTIISKRITGIHVVMIGFALALIATFALALGGAITWISIILFGVLGLVQGASFAAIPQLNRTSEDQARANGAMAQMGNLGNTIGTPILLSLLLAFGFPGLIIGIATCFALGLLVHFVMGQKRANAG